MGEPEKFTLRTFVKNASWSVKLAGGVTVAALAQLNPVTAAWYAGAATYVAMMEDHRREIFLDGFDGQGSEATEQSTTTEEFARAACVTFQAAAQTADDDKTRRLARLLRNGLDEGLLCSFDEFKEYVQLLDELSPRELALLLLLDEERGRIPGAAFGMKLPDDVVDEGGDAAAIVSAERVAWLRTEKRAGSELGLRGPYLEFAVDRIARTGLMRLRPGRAGEESTPQLSQLFRRLRELIA